VLCFLRVSFVCYITSAMADVIYQLDRLCSTQIFGKELI
jgi:hypothetical protein